MSDRPRLLDLFCGAGGAAMGYHRAGFDVTGVDNVPQPRYPFRFWCLDALAIEPWALMAFDAIHASPPCQRFSVASRATGVQLNYPDLIEPARTLLRESGRPYVIENVRGAPLLAPYLLCGSMVGLPIRKHRYFECSFPLMVPTCQHGLETGRFRTLHSVRGWYDARVVHTAGSTGGKGGVALRRRALGIEWATAAELAQAIPPVYTELIGHQLHHYL